jgi:hypothetical protein
MYQQPGYQTSSQPYHTQAYHPPTYPTQPADYSKEDKLSKKVRDPILAVVAWVQKRNPKEKGILLGVAGLLVSTL